MSLPRMALSIASVIKMSRRNFSEKDLNIDLCDIVLEIIREFYVAAKKASIYSFSHPLAQKAVGRLFFQMGEIFKLKQYINFHIESGHLFVMNIGIKPSIFADQVIDYMQLLDIRDVLFNASLTVDQLGLFLGKLVKRVPTGVYQNMMQDYLAENGIDSIGINCKKGIRIFEKGFKYRADIVGDFSVRNIMGQSIGEDPEILAGMLADEDCEIEQYIEKYNIDFYPQLVAYLIPEKISIIDADAIFDVFSDMISKTGGSAEDVSTQDILKTISNLVRALNHHPRKEEIFSRIESHLAEGKISKEICSRIMPQTSAMRVESSEKINQFLYATFNQELPGHNLNDFEDLFGRIIRTGQQSRAEAVINILITHLAGPHFELRERALILFRYILGTNRQATGSYILDHIIGKIDEYLSEERETFEFSDLIRVVSRSCLASNDYGRLSALCDTLSKKCNRTGGINCYESVAVKKGIEELDRADVIDQLVSELLKEDSRNSQYIRRILVTIASEEAAFALASIISHDSRQVRMNVLKILSEMGKPALKVCGGILEDNSNFMRHPDKRELPDDRWYIVRNAIFVLGALEDPEGCRALRYRISEDDTRVRLAIVTALEKIGDESAADLLLVMADDIDREIREAAIIALGFTGHAEMVPELIDLAERRNTEILNIISTLGKLGGADARDFLANLLIDNKMQSKYTSNRSSREEIKLATIKALGRIGDSEALLAVKNFNESLTSTQKIFFGGSKMNKAAEDILKRGGD